MEIKALAHPEKIEVNLSFDDLKKTTNIVGCVLFLKGQETGLLVGDCNECGGGCECCSQVMFSDIIEYYYRVYP